MSDYASAQHERIDEGEEVVDKGSFNHSSVQANLAFLFKRLGVYRVSTELSLDVSNADLIQRKRSVSVFGGTGTKSGEPIGHTEQSGPRPTSCPYGKYRMIYFTMCLTGLATKDEIKPDVCLYPKRSLSRPFDILRMSEMPLLIVEILSPRQGTEEILRKFAVYFQVGVKSCWLVDPATEIVVVYRALDQHKTFSEGELFDAVMDLRLLIDEIFE